MTLGFADTERVGKLKKELVGWELYRVEIDKYHIMFWFEDGHCLINSAYRFEYESADRSVSYVYDVYAPGDRKFLNVDKILRCPVSAIEPLDDRRLALIFSTGDKLIIHDSPTMRSAWFYRYDPASPNGRIVWAEDDTDGYE